MLTKEVESVKLYKLILTADVDRVEICMDLNPSNFTQSNPFFSFCLFSFLWQTICRDICIYLYLLYTIDHLLYYVVSA